MIDEIIEIFKQRQNYIIGKFSYVLTGIACLLTVGISFSAISMAYQNIDFTLIISFLEVLVLLGMLIKITPIFGGRIEKNRENLEQLYFIKAKSQGKFNKMQQNKLNQILELIHKENISKKKDSQEKNISRLIEKLAKEFESIK